MDKITNEVEELFKEKDQWDSFLELTEKSEKISEDWFSKLKPSLNYIFNVEDINDEWEFDSTGDKDYRWYLKEFGRNTIYLFFDNVSFGLFANGDIMNIQSLKSKLREKNFLPIRASLERLDYCLEDDEEWYLIYETGNFSFGSLSDKNIDEKSLAWYANYRNEEFIYQIKNKVDKFRKSKDIIKLFIRRSLYGLIPRGLPRL